MQSCGFLCGGACWRRLDLNWGAARCPVIPHRARGLLLKLPPLMDSSLSMRCLSRCTFLMFALVGIASPNAFAQKLKISQVVWGFDGRVTPNQFNPVSILVDNPSDEAFEGRISIRQASGTGQAVGASFVENGVYIQALGRRCLLYTSPSPRDLSTSRMPSSA